MTMTDQIRPTFLAPRLWLATVAFVQGCSSGAPTSKQSLSTSADTRTAQWVADVHVRIDGYSTNWTTGTEQALVDVDATARLRRVTAPDDGTEVWEGPVRGRARIDANMAKGTNVDCLNTHTSGRGELGGGMVRVEIAHGVAFATISFWPGTIDGSRQIRVWGKDQREPASLSTLRAEARLPIGPTGIDQHFTCANVDALCTPEGPGPLLGSDEYRVWFTLRRADAPPRTPPRSVFSSELAELELPACGVVSFGVIPEPPPPPPPPPPMPSVQIIPPVKLLGLRTSGSDEVSVDAALQAEMARYRPIGHRPFKVCIDEAGGLTTVKIMKSSGFPAWDDAAVATIRAWSFSPWIKDGVGTPVCTMLELSWDFTRVRATRP